MKILKDILVLLAFFVGTVSCSTREYFIGIKEIQWDYAPSGKNLILNKTVVEDENAAEFLAQGENRIGRVYKKAVYFQYTDGSFKQELGKPAWLGYLGPIMFAEEGDTIIVTLKNMASRPYTLHAHGVSYNKASEGAVYPDHTEGMDKADDHVGPGQSFRYVWNLTTDHAPTKDDTNCLTRVYHSHINAPKDIASGLIGPLIICKKDTLDVHGDQTSDDIFALMFTISDENLSWYLDDNINTYCTAPSKVDKEDQAFQDSNKMYSINGYVYGNLPGLSLCVGHKTHWHLFGMGNEADVHSAFFHGQILTERKHHVDTVSLFPASFVNAEMEPVNPGRWLLSCQINDHLGAGMEAFFEVKNCFPDVHKPKPHGNVRQYYIAAEEVIWDYGPTKINQFTGNPLKSDKIGGRYKKAIYVEYTDDTFTKHKERTPEEEHLGILGPVIRAEVEDTIKVTFRNKATRPYSIQPHGVQYSIDQEGTLYNSELHLLATVFDENLSWYLDDNIKQFAKSPKMVNKDDEDFQESNKMHSINGYMYGNLKGLNMCKGDTVSWHLSGLGSEVDIHGMYFQGNRFTIQGTRRDAVNLFPHISHTVIMNPDSIGTFGVVCRTTDHFQGGMKANYTVDKCRFWDLKPDIYLHHKTYYIAATEIEWDYSPNRMWEHKMHEDKFIGSKYKKVVYREYTDKTFTREKERLPQEEHLEILGPIIHAETGDKVNIVFKNMASRPYSIHAHGVKTETAEIQPTPPGETHTYTWYVPKSAGPGPNEEECLVGAYFSTVDVTKDLYSGLIGPLVICERSLLRKIGLKEEIKEFALLFMVFDENESWYLDENIKNYVSKGSKVQKDDEEFIESNKMHGINGRIYNNLRGLTMEVGDKVYWHLMGMGNEVDMHTAHFHGHSFEYKLSGTHRHDVYELFPATFQTVKMKAQYPGTWLLHCHVTDHIVAGMETTYTKILFEETKSW
uniref:ferroxidase n=1 Tax=Scleropages formosus TaxID=113540 RepID=A0A8C9TB37_SCLFO